MASHSLQIRRRGGWRNCCRNCLRVRMEKARRNALGVSAEPARCCLARRSPSFLVSGLASDTLARSLTHPADERTRGRTDEGRPRPGRNTLSIRARSIARPTLQTAVRVLSLLHRGFGQERAYLLDIHEKYVIQYRVAYSIPSSFTCRGFRDAVPRPALCLLLDDRAPHDIRSCCQGPPSFPLDQSAQSEPPALNEM